jgi:hypothetical protein
MTPTSKLRLSRCRGSHEGGKPKVEFNWSNDEWAVAQLQRIRLAGALIAHDDDELLAVFKKLIPDGVVPDMLEGLAHTKRHIEDLHAVLNATLMRSFAVLERCGYGPDNPN